MGGLDNIDAAVFADFDYVRWATSTSRSSVPGRPRYAGSLMKYSFSEVNQKKSVTVVEMEEKGEISIRTVPLAPPHDMRLVEGLMDDVLAMPYSEDYVWVTLRDELPPPGTHG